MPIHGIVPARTSGCAGVPRQANLTMRSWQSDVAPPNRNAVPPEFDRLLERHLLGCEAAPTVWSERESRLQPNDPVGVPVLVALEPLSG